MVVNEYYKQIAQARLHYAPRAAILRIVVSLAFIVGCESLAKSEVHKVTIPQTWKSQVSVGELIVDSNAFYGVPWFAGLYPAVRLNLPVENLTSDVLYLKFNYRTEGKQKGYGNSGMGVTYALGPHEKRLIDTIVPIGSVTRPIRFLLTMGEPSSASDSPSSPGAQIVVIDPFKVSKVAAQDIRLTKVENGYFEVQEIKLTYSKEQGNLVVFKIKNKTNQDSVLGAYVAVNDPENIETKAVLARPRGFFSDSIEIIRANGVAGFSAPYNIPPVGPGPVLAFTLFKPHQEGTKPGERGSRRWDMTLVAYGSFNLNRAAERGECVIPVHPPAEERAKLTAEKKSEHFLFRYRPGSYTEQNIDRTVRGREEAYEKLCKVLQMELPVTVTIDLYPDMEAKALGSGTTWTPANTRSNKHICEVNNEEYQCDPYHELAHIFSYYFPNYSSNRGGMPEAFAAYFEPDNMPIGETKEILRRKLSGGKLSSLAEVLLSNSSSEELVVLIDFLLKKDLEKFKAFYVSVTTAKEKAEFDKASRQMYGTDLKDLEEQWHDYINQRNDT